MMPRLVEKLTPLAISKVVKPGYYGDGAGLWLQVSPSGSKSWIFRFTLAGRQREMGLGAVHTVSLPEARAKAKACRQVLLDGKDPLEARKATRLAAEAVGSFTADGAGGGQHAMTPAKQESRRWQDGGSDRDKARARPHARWRGGVRGGVEGTALAGGTEPWRGASSARRRRSSPLGFLS